MEKSDSDNKIKEIEHEDINNINIESSLKEIGSEIDIIDNELMNQTVSKDQIAHDLFILRKNLIYIEIAINNKNLNDKYGEKIKKYDDHYKLLHELYTNITANETKHRVHILTLVSIIFVPLTVLVGFIGIKFTRSDTNPLFKDNITDMSSGQIIAIVIIAISVAISYSVYKYII